MPPKKRGSGGPSSSAAKGKQSASKARQSKLAKENDISAEEEAEIKEAFHLFALKGLSGWEDEKEGVIRREDVRRCMIALGLPPSSPSELSSFLDALDPDNEGYAPYGPFVSICALKLHNRTDDSVAEEVETAFKLFTKGTNGPITAVHLRRVAKELKEDVSDEMLRGMILEANGGAGVNKGVGLDDFEGVMRRAGVF